MVNGQLITVEQFQVERDCCLGGVPMAENCGSERVPGQQWQQGQRELLIRT